MSFPSDKACVSPNFKWEVRCRTEQQGDDGGPRSLLLQPLGATKPILIHTFYLDCDMLWSEDSQRIALTDRDAVSSEIYIVEVSNHTVQLLEIPDLSKALGKDIFGDDLWHIYCEAVKWEGPDRLQIKIFGNTVSGQPRRFTYLFSTDIISKESTLLRQIPNEAAD